MISTVLAVLVRPWLWPSALRFVPPRWWAHRPFLPVPPREYRDFRMVTMYGDPNHPYVADDLIRFLGWCRRTHKEASK